jgi:FAD/FMN-containing dehydrogenase/Fe-S oxidoreductase
LKITNSAKKKFIQKIKGEVFFDELTRRIYAYSASICYLLPAAVIYPLDKDDVINTIRIASEEGIPVTARGAGSGVAGQNLGEGVILDFSMHMNRILDINPQDRTATVEPGLIRTKFIKALQPAGLFFPPDPSSSDYATLGGMIANNSGGAHSLLYGTTKNYVKSLTVIASDAEEFIITNSGLAPLKYKKEVKELLQEASLTLKKHKPESFRNSCGYNLFEASMDGEVNFTKIFCGSEGTLGIFTEIKLDLLRLPSFRNSVLLCYKDALTALSEVKDFLDLHPSTVQALADEFLQIVATEEPDKYARLPKDSEFILLVEFDGDDLRELNKRANELIKRSSAFEVRLAENSSELDWIWEIRRSATAYLSRLPGNKPTRWIEDAAVPVEKLSDFVLGLNNLLKKYKTSAALFGHACQGLLHFSPRLDRMSPGFSRLIENLGREHALFAMELKGVPSGEHGDGLLRTPYLKEIWGEVYPYFEKLKKIFDPNFRLNPLSIVPVREYKVRDFLRFYEGYQHKDSGALNRVVDIIEACHGCGKCKDFCPVTRSIEGEIGSSRARINLLREIISGHIKEPFKRSDLLGFFNLCLHCKTCKRECPTGIDIAELIESFFEERYLRKSAQLPEKILSKPRLLGQLALKTGRFSKTILNSEFFGKVAGLSGLANLNHLIFEPLKKKELLNHDKKNERKAIIFSGCSGDFFNSSEIKSVLKLLEKLGYETELMSGYCCGEPAFARGFKAEGEAKLKESITLLKEYINSETPVIFTSPSCLLPFFEHSEKLFNKNEIKKVKESFYEAVHFLEEQFLRIKDDFRNEIKEDSESPFPEEISRKFFNNIELKIAVQIPCHLKVLGKDNSLMKFIRMLPVADVIELKTNCCGFGGSRGFEKKWAKHADKIGEALTHEISTVKPDIIVSQCVTCRLQMRKLLGVKTLFSESEDLHNLLLSDESRELGEIRVVHPLILASEMLKKT